MKKINFFIILFLLLIGIEEGSCIVSSDSIYKRSVIEGCTGAGLDDCDKVVVLYEYTIGEDGFRGEVPPESTVDLYFDSSTVNCYDKTDVTIAYYDEDANTWVEKDTTLAASPGTLEGDYKATAPIDYLGYIALIRTEECVPTLCTYRGYRIVSATGVVTTGNVVVITGNTVASYEETIKFELSGMVSGCEAIEDGACSRACPGDADPDCPEPCTSGPSDCCLISKDDICDPDCAPNVDPDCCDKNKELCCPGGLTRSGSSECDENCGVSDPACADCTSGDDHCCNVTKDNATDYACDPDCPMLSNGIGYVDVDCCSYYTNGSIRTSDVKINITKNGGDCCKAVCDGTCDPDCIAGLDPDCYDLCLYPYCGDGICQSSESCSTCATDCGVCPEEFQRSLNLYYLKDDVWQQFGHVQIRDIHYHTEIIEPPEGMFEGKNPKLLVNSIDSRFSPSIVDKENGLVAKQSIFSKIISFLTEPFVKEVAGTADTQTSTPIIAVNTGTDYVLDNDFLFGNPESFNSDYEAGKSFYETGEIKNGDKYILKIKPEIINGKIKLRILEYEYEESFIDQLELYAVKHDKSTQMFVKDDYTKVYALKPDNLVYPTSCKTSEGEDCMPYLNNKGKDLVLNKGQYADITIEGKKIRIAWTDTHKLDSITLLKDGTEYPFETKKLKLTKAYSHRLKQDLKEKLLEKDFDYLHTMRGDVIDLEFEAEEADDYMLTSEGFYTNLRAYMYPGVDFDYVEKFIEPKQENE